MRMTPSPGEPVLFQLIEWLRDRVRTSDAVARYGPNQVARSCHARSGALQVMGGLVLYAELDLNRLPPGLCSSRYLEHVRHTQLPPEPSHSPAATHGDDPPAEELAQVDVRDGAWAVRGNVLQSSDKPYPPTSFTPLLFRGRGVSAFFIPPPPPP
jgi:hypothetical protein